MLSLMPLDRVLRPRDMKDLLCFYKNGTCQDIVNTSTAKLLFFTSAVSKGLFHLSRNLHLAINITAIVSTARSPLYLSCWPSHLLACGDISRQYELSSYCGGTAKDNAYQNKISLCTCLSILSGGPCNAPPMIRQVRIIADQASQNKA